MNNFIIEHCPVNPTLEYAEKMVLSVPKDATQIVSKGGGSSIDVGKWVAKTLGLPHHVIPTTAGTGSEVTKYCVLMVDGKKTTFTDEAFIPTSYEFQPKLVTTCPQVVTISSGLDALSQAFEAAWSKNATQESRIYSDTAINMIPKALVACIDKPQDENARMTMLIAANFAGRAINITKTNVCHAVSYPLTEWYGIPHGIACAMSLAFFAQKATSVDLSEFIKALKLPAYKIDKEKVAKEVIYNEKLKDYPIEIHEQDIIEAL